jgi:hypothetical protein
MTFDVIADLLFGEPFGCLRELKTHRFVTLLWQAVLASRFFCESSTASDRSAETKPG